MYPKRISIAVAATVSVVAILTLCGIVPHAPLFALLSRNGVTAESKEEFLSEDGMVTGDPLSPIARLQLAAIAQPEKSIVTLKIERRSLSRRECRVIANLGTLVILQLIECDIPAGHLSAIVKANPHLQYLWIDGSGYDFAPLEAVYSHPSLCAISVGDNAVAEADVKLLEHHGIAVVRSPVFLRLLN